MHFLIDNYALPAINDDRRMGYTTSNLKFLAHNTAHLSTVIVNDNQLLFFNKRAYRLLSSIEQLSDNWDGDGAIAPPKYVIGQTYQAITSISMMGQKIYNIAPGPYGEIMISLKGKAGELELLFYPEKVKYIKLPHTENPSQGAFILQELFDLLKWLTASHE